MVKNKLTCDGTGIGWVEVAETGLWFVFPASSTPGSVDGRLTEVWAGRSGSGLLLGLN